MSAAADTTALKIDDLIVRMGAQQILDGVSLTVPERGIVTVLGANGVGKTTLMRTISGLYRASAGRITFAGESIANGPATRSSAPLTMSCSVFRCCASGCHSRPGRFPAASSRCCASAAH